MLKGLLFLTIALSALISDRALASVNVVVNGTTYVIPQTNEKGWGNNVTLWIQAMSANTLQPNGGTFTLTADADFGATFGLKSTYFKSRTANIASSGAFRMAVADSFGWRNNANTGDLLLSVDGANNLLYNATKVLLSGAIVNADVSASAAIARSKLGTGTINQVVINDGAGNFSSEANLAITRGGTGLGAVGTANQIFGTNNAATAYEQKSATLTAAGSLTIPSAQTISIPDGTVTAPSVMYTSETNTGWYRNAAANPSLAITGTQSFDINKLSSTQINFGFGQAASGLASNPLSASTTYNGTANFSYANLSAGAASNTAFYIGNGPGGGNGITVENQAYASTAYTGGGGVLSAGPNLTQLIIASETTSSPTIRFDVGGRTAAKEAMVLSPASLTINKGTNLVMSGSTSGALSINAGAATTSYGITMPTAQGGTGTVLTNSDGAGTMTWTSPLVNPMTTLGDIPYENATPAITRLPGNITTTKKYLSQTGNGSISAAPVWSGLPLPTIQKFTSSSGTYTTPAGVIWIRVRMVGGGGGGGGSGTTAGTSGGTGGTSTFGTSLLSASGGTGGGTGGSTGSAGGASSLGAGPIGIALTGGSGGGAGATAATASYASGGMGGSSPLGGGGYAGAAANGGGAGVPNTGGGGGGAATGSSVNANAGAGGGSGGYVDAIITSPLATYAYAVGAAGTAGTAGTAGAGGSLGGSGVIIVEEYYQ